MSTSLQSFNNKTNHYRITTHSKTAQFLHPLLKKRKYQLIQIPDRKFLNHKLLLNNLSNLKRTLSVSMKVKLSHLPKIQARK